MRLLLDTHIALWAITDDPRLSDEPRKLIVDLDNEIFVSAASLWEITIKFSLARGGPNDMPVSGEQALGYFRQSGYRTLSIESEHVVAVAALPDLHKDPFDRLLVAQALTEPLHLLTHDKLLAGYGDLVLVV